MFTDEPPFIDNETTFELLNVKAYDDVPFVKVYTGYLFPLFPPLETFNE